MVLPKYDDNNIFAKILRGEIPSHKIFETSHCLAILDAMPMAEGHALLLPKYPCVSIVDCPSDVAAAVFSELPRLAKMVRAATGAPAVKIVQNTGAEAGQEVFHMHIHVIPRHNAKDPMVSSKNFITPQQAAPLIAKMQASESGGEMLASMYKTSLDTLSSLVDAMRDGDITKPPPKPAAAAGGQGRRRQGRRRRRRAARGHGAGREGEGQEGGGGRPAGGGGAGGDEARAVDVSWAEIRVGRILDASPHPDSDKLYVETIDLGEASPRQVLSGLAQHMPLEAVKGALVVCICNLKARKIAGTESQAMVLCASDADKSKLCFVTPPEGSAPGELVTWEGYPGAPEASKKMDKKKAWEAIQPLLATDASGVCVYKGSGAGGTAAFTLKGGVCTAPGVAGGIIS